MLRISCISYSENQMLKHFSFSSIGFRRIKIRIKARNNDFQAPIVLRCKESLFCKDLLHTRHFFFPKNNTYILYGTEHHLCDTLGDYVHNVCFLNQKTSIVSSGTVSHLYSFQQCLGHRKYSASYLLNRSNWATKFSWTPPGSALELSLQTADRIVCVVPPGNRRQDPLKTSLTERLKNFIKADSVVITLETERARLRRY